MKNVLKTITVGVGLITTLATVQAAGTLAGTIIENTATVDFVVSGINQPDASSNASGFIVDRRVSFTLVKDDGAKVAVLPNATDRVLTYTLTNTGNSALDFNLSAIQPVGGSDGFAGTDTSNVSSVSAIADENGNGTYQNGTDVDTYVDELAVDTAVKVFAVASIGALVNGNIAAINMQATAAQSGTASTEGTALAGTTNATADIDDGDQVVDGSLWDNTGDIQTVFADSTGTGGDAANDGIIRALDAYEVVSANLVVTKSSVVISDPVNGVTNPKRIPGAVVEYTISIQNNGAVDADDLALTDVLDTDTTFDNTHDYDGGQGGTQPIEVDGVGEDEGAIGADETDPNGGSHAAGTVSAFIDQLVFTGSPSKVVKFRVTVD